MEQFQPTHTAGTSKSPKESQIPKIMVSQEIFI